MRTSIITLALVTTVLASSNEARACSMCGSFGSGGPLISPTMPHDWAAFGMMTSSLIATGAGTLGLAAFRENGNMRWLGPTIGLAVNAAQLAGNAALIARYGDYDDFVMSMLFVGPSLGAAFSLATLILGLNRSEPLPITPTVSVPSSGAAGVEMGIVLRL